MSGKKDIGTIVQADDLPFRHTGRIDPIIRLVPSSSEICWEVRSCSDRACLRVEKFRIEIDIFHEETPFETT